MFTLTKSKELPFGPDLLAFVRIFTAPPALLERLALQEKEQLQSLQEPCVTEKDIDTLEFLEKRYCLIGLGGFDL